MGLLATSYREKNLFDIAYALASKGCKAGILNPSDKEALSSGNLGQFWYGGHVALEEAFMYQTTILFNNWAFTKEVPPGWLETVNQFSQNSLDISAWCSVF